MYDTYWRFAAERLAIYYRRLEGGQAPWTTDPILRTYRFTNAYRAADRVSQYLISAHGPLAWSSIDLDALDCTLSRLMSRGRKIYSPAYIMPAPPFGAERKHSNHLKLVAKMMNDRLPDRLRQAPDLQSVYERIRAYPGLGPFLAFQYAIDLNYSTLLDFSEEDFVVAGPGALDGISKCFT